MGRKCPFGSPDLGPVRPGPESPGDNQSPNVPAVCNEGKALSGAGVWALVGPVALMTAFEAGSRQWILRTHLLSRGRPQGCYQCLGVSLKEVSLEFSFLFKPCLAAGFGGFLLGTVNLKGHFYQVLEGV